MHSQQRAAWRVSGHKINLYSTLKIPSSLLREALIVVVAQATSRLTLSHKIAWFSNTVKAIIKVFARCTECKDAKLVDSCL